MPSTRRRPSQKQIGEFLKKIFFGKFTYCNAVDPTVVAKWGQKITTSAIKKMEFCFFRKYIFFLALTGHSKTC